MGNNDKTNIFKRFLNWFFPKKLYDPLDKKIDHESNPLDKKIEDEPKPLKLDNEDTGIDEKLEKLKQYIKINKELDSLNKKHIIHSHKSYLAGSNSIKV